MTQEFAFFPSRTLAFYMARMFLLRSIAVLAALVVVLQTLDLLGQSGKVLAHPGNGQAELWRYVSLRMPQIVAQFLPFSVLLGTIITFVTLNQNSEVVAMKAGGVSAHQLLAPLVLASVLVAGVSFAFNDRIVARSTETLNAWEAADYGAVPIDRGVASNVWVRDGDDLIHADTARGKGDKAGLTGVTVYDRTGGSLVSIITATHAEPSNGGWRLREARRFEVERGVEVPVSGLLIGMGVRTDQFTLASVNAEERSFGALSAAIEDLREAGRPTTALESGLWHKLSSPLSSMLMPLLAAVAAFGIARSGKLFVRAVIGMGLGFAYFVADNFALAMGNLGAYPPFLAAWSPFLLFLLIGEAVLVRTEE